jgi:hypothetical protein
MSFGGGGGGGAITAHDHSNLSSEGGSLNLDTEMNNAPLFAQGIGWW